MAIVSCPACGKKISDNATLCEHCNFQRSQISAERQAVLRWRQARDTVYHWNMAGYAVIALFLAGFGWYWWASDGYAQPSSAGPFYLMAVAAMAYAVVRVFLFQAKRRLKQLRQVEP